MFKILLLLGTSACAQVEMADDFRGEGKIYVVIAIFLLIIIGFFVLLFKLDRRTKRLERETKNNEN
ncbi:MAG: CcmD family protein [Bacteroidota bacterium]